LAHSRHLSRRIRSSPAGNVYRSSRGGSVPIRGRSAGAQSQGTVGYPRGAGRPGARRRRTDPAPPGTPHRRSPPVTMFSSCQRPDAGGGTAVHGPLVREGGPHVSRDSPVSPQGRRRGGPVRGTLEGGRGPRGRRGGWPGKVLREVTATRYVAPLRTGGSVPGVVEADDLGTYVVKVTGSGRSPGLL
jgi:hypothetical protein